MQTFVTDYKFSELVMWTAYGDLRKVIIRYGVVVTADAELFFRAGRIKSYEGSGKRTDLVEICEQNYAVWKI